MAFISLVLQRIFLYVSDFTIYKLQFTGGLEVGPVPLGWPYRLTANAGIGITGIFRLKDPSMNLCLFNSPL